MALSNARGIELGVRRRRKDFLQVLRALLAALRAQLRQDRRLPASLRQIADVDIELAQIFAGALVIGVKVQRLLVESQTPSGSRPSSPG